MKKVLAVFWFIIISTLAAQDKPPVITPESKAAILEIQLRMVQAQNEYAQLQERVRTLQETFQKDSTALQIAQGEACKEAKADCDKWTLNLQTLKFEAKAKAATPAPTPEKKP